MLRVPSIAEADGWDISNDLLCYRQHELADAIAAIVETARQDNATRRVTNVAPSDAVQSALKQALDVELYAYGLKVVRRPNWRGANYS